MSKILVFSPILENIICFRKELIFKLRELNYDVVLVCSYSEEDMDLLSVGVRMINISIDRRGTNLLREIKLIYKYIRVLSEESPSVVLTYTSKSSIYGGIASRITRCPYIVNNSGLFDSSRIGKYFGIFLNILHRLGYSKANCIMYQNEEEMTVMNRVLRNSVPYKLIPGSGVNLIKFQPTPYPATDSVSFIMICRIQKEKGIEEYLYAVNCLTEKYQDIHFSLLGGFEEEKYKTEVLKLVDKGKLTYYEPVKDIRPFLNDTCCVVNPSYHEGMSNVLLESAASARPSIASDCTGCNDIIKDGVNGFLAKVADKDSLTYAIEKFYLLPNDEKREMGLNGRILVEEKFDRNIVINAYLEEITRILQ